MEALDAPVTLVVMFVLGPNASGSLSGDDEDEDEEELTNDGLFVLLVRRERVRHCASERNNPNIRLATRGKHSDFIVIINSRSFSHHGKFTGEDA